MKIACVGPFGDANFGDYAMLVNNIYSLGKHEYTIFSYDIGLLNDIEDTYLEGYDIKKIILQSNYKFNSVYSGKYKVEYDDKCYTPLEILSMVESTEIYKNIVDTDILLVIGGGYFNRVWNAKHRKAKLLTIMSVILVANQLKKKIVFMGNTFGPFDESSEFFASFFNSLINVKYASRDDWFSKSNMLKLGVSSNIELIPDDLYFLNDKIKSFPSKYNYSVSGEYIVLELYSSIDEIKENLENIRDFVLTMKNKYNLSVILLPLDKKYGGEYQSDIINKEISDIIYFDFKEEQFRKIEDINYILKNAKFVLCERYHMFVFAIVNNIPALHILKDVCGDKRYYYAKTSGLLKQVYKNQIIDEANFMNFNIKDALNFINSNLDDIINYQIKTFNIIKNEDENLMKKSRENYINGSILID